ncbi:MAG: hypothetical protein KAR47_14955 [Planctomycetes bacterium]|nr:hypothetical protein [Planctomycetota bacterium]
MTKRLLDTIEEDFHDVFTAIVELTDEFCEEHLNEDYKQLASDMAEALCGKGSLVNVKQGRPKSWAGGIIHALGWVNFLPDPATEPYMSSTDLAKGFGVSQGTMAAKSKIIRDAMDIMPMDPDWCLADLLDDNPLVWMLELDGFIVDIRKVRREIQEAAFREGLIPYIPADKKQAASQSGQETENIKFPGIQKKAPKPKPARKTRDEGPTLF